MESEGPYKHYRLCDEAPCVEGSCMACVYAEGRESIMPALEKAEMALKDVHDGYLDATPDGSTFFDWIVWDRLATEALSAIRDARGKK
jgi:hypothetical protein